MVPLIKIPILSIIIPVFNTEKYIERCINSVREQTYNNWELILVNDGSYDHSGDICNHYSYFDQRIKVFHIQNGGQSKARNFGLNKAKGRYIAFIDSDDFLDDSSTIEESINYLENSPDCDIVQYPFEGKGWTNSNNGLHITPYQEIIGGKDAIENFGLEGLGQIIYPAPWGKIYRAAVFNNIRFKEGMVFEDSYLLTDLLKIVRKVCIIEKGKYCYMCNEASTMNQPLTPKRAVDALTSHIHTLDVCKELKIDHQSYSSFVDCVTNDTYCAIIFLKQNIFPKYLLRSLQHHIDNTHGKAKSQRATILRCLCKIIGIRNLANIQLKRRKFFNNFLANINHIL